MKKTFITQFLIALLFLVSYTSLNAQSQWSCNYNVQNFWTGTLTFEAVSATGTPCDAEIKITVTNVANEITLNSNDFIINNGICTSCPFIPLANNSTGTILIDGNSGISCNNVSITMPSFFGGTCASATTPVLTSLPVELVDFKGQATVGGILLTWQTASEENNDGFEIERSADGKSWSTIDFVQGQGTTQEVQDYTYTDKSPLAGTNYYRLKQMDFDGAFEYSEVVTITMERLTNKTVTMFPNPVSNQLNIVNGEGTATIYNLLGQPVQEFVIRNSQFVIPTTDLPKGQYILSITQQNGIVVSKQFVK